MALERPEHSAVTVNVDTLGATARQMKTLEGLKDWAGVDNADLCFGACGAFWPAGNLTRTETDALKAAWREVKAIDKLTGHYTDALGAVGKKYGDTDRHSAAAVAKAADGMSQPPAPDAPQ